MTKAAHAVHRDDDAPLCRFKLGQVQLEVRACEAQPAEGTQGLLAAFDHAGMHFAVREVQGEEGRSDPLDAILTAREREIARLVAAGLRNKQIAYELRLSEYTVAAYVKHVCYKLQVRNRTAMVTRCSQLGATPPGELSLQACRGAAAR
jgi:DNA-binding CsgD family transcriptional regulator